MWYSGPTGKIGIIFNPVGSSGGIVRFSAAQGNERAWMDPKLQRSVFGGNDYPRLYRAGVPTPTVMVRYPKPS